MPSKKKKKKHDTLISDFFFHSHIAKHSGRQGNSSGRWKRGHETSTSSFNKIQIYYIYQPIL